MTRPRGRPRTGSLLSVDDVFAAVADRLEHDLPITQADLAADLGTNRRTLVEVIERDSGLDWRGWISRISRTSDEDTLDDHGMKRITVTLGDETFVALRRQALKDLRDPRLQARLILERGLAVSEAPRRIDADRRDAA